MRPGLCLLLLLGAAADDRVVLRRGDAAPVSVPPLEPGTRARCGERTPRCRRGADARTPRGARAAPGRRGCRRGADARTPRVGAAPGRRGAAARGRADPVKECPRRPRTSRAAARTRGPRGVPAPPPDPGARAPGPATSDDDDACQYVSVSGTTGQTSREGTYERVGAVRGAALLRVFGLQRQRPPVHLEHGVPVVYRARRLPARDRRRHLGLTMRPGTSRP